MSLQSEYITYVGQYAVFVAQDMNEFPLHANTRLSYSVTYHCSDVLLSSTSVKLFIVTQKACELFEKPVVVNRSPYNVSKFGIHKRIETPTFQNNSEFFI